jgi:hypothetical protein
MNQNDISAWQRWIAPMPAFFKPIFYIAMAIMSANAFFLLIDMQLLNFQMERPEWFSKLSGWIAIGAAIVSKFTVDFKKMQEEKALDDFSGKAIIDKRAEVIPPPRAMWGQVPGVNNQTPIRRPKSPDSDRPKPKS